MRIYVLLLLFSLFSICCTEKEKDIFLDNLLKTDQISINVRGKVQPCMTRYLSKDEIEFLKQTLDGKVKKVDTRKFDSKYYLILYQDDAERSQFSIDSSDSNLIRFVNSEFDFTFQVDYNLDNYFDKLTGINNYDCAETFKRVRLDSVSVFDFIKMLKIENPIPNGVYLLNTFGNAPANWISKNDIAQMIELVDSQKRTYCIMQMISSNMPDLLEYSTLGGQIMNIIDSYRFNRRYPYFLTNCAKNDEMRKKEILDWWKKQ